MNPLTLPGIEPATFRFVAQHLNHCATLPRSPLCAYFNFGTVGTHFARLGYGVFGVSLDRPRTGVEGPRPSAGRHTGELLFNLLCENVTGKTRQ